MTRTRRRRWRQLPNGKWGMVEVVHGGDCGCGYCTGIKRWAKRKDKKAERQMLKDELRRDPDHTHQSRKKFPGSWYR